MSRIARLKVKGEPAVYHIMSRTALDGFVIGDVEKDYFLSLIKKMSSCLLYTSPSPRDRQRSRMPSSA